MLHVHCVCLRDIMMFRNDNDDDETRRSSKKRKKQQQPSKSHMNSFGNVRNIENTSVECVSVGLYSYTTYP